MSVENLVCGKNEQATWFGETEITTSTRPQNTNHVYTVSQEIEVLAGQFFALLWVMPTLLSLLSTFSHSRGDRNWKRSIRFLVMKTAVHTSEGWGDASAFLPMEAEPHSAMNSEIYSCLHLVSGSIVCRETFPVCIWDDSIRYNAKGPVLLTH